MGNCKDCKWWVDIVLRRGECLLARSTLEMPEYASLAVAYGRKETSGYLETDAMFGCVQFRQVVQ